MPRKFVLTTLLLSATGSFAEIYSWRDADGKVHFSDQAPAGEKSSARVVNLPPDSGAAQGAGTTAPRTTGNTTKATTIQAENDEREKQRKAKQIECDNAKKAMQEFQDSPRRTAVSSRGGKRSFNAVDGEERAEKEAELQKAIDKACNP